MAHSPTIELIFLLQKCLSPEDVRAIADDYGERFRSEKDSRGQKESLYERLVDNAGGASVVRLLVLYAAHRKDVMGLLRIISEHRPDLQQAIHALGFEPSSLIRVYLAALLQEAGEAQDNVAESPALRYGSKTPGAPWSEVNPEMFLTSHPRIILSGATPTVRLGTLHHLARLLVSGWRASDPTTPVPIYADLRRWYNPHMNLLQFLRAQMAWSGMPQFAELLSELVRDSRVVLLLDGLDELPYSKRNATTGLREDPRVHAIIDRLNASCVLTCQARDFLAGPYWYDLDVLGAAQEALLDRPEDPAQRLKTHISAAIERVAGQMTDNAVAGLQTRLGYLALNMSDARQSSAGKQLAASWLFHLGEAEKNNPQRYRQPEATPEEQQQAARFLQLAEDAGLLIAGAEDVQFAHPHIQNYFCVCYCLSQALDEPGFLERVSVGWFSETWRLWMEFDPALVDKLLSLLQHADSSDLRSATARALSWLEDSRAVDPLIDALRDADPGLRWRAAFALGVLGDNRAVEPLIAALRDSVPNVREFAASALGKIEDERRMQPLIEALNDENGHVRFSVAFTLKGFHDVRLIEPMVALLADYEGHASGLAQEALIAFGEEAVPSLMVALTDLEIGKQYSHRRGEVPYNAAEVLGKIGDIRPLPLLLWLIEHDHEVGEAHFGSKVRHVAAEAVEQIRQRHQAIAPLVAALRSEDKTVHTAAAFALGLHGDHRATEPLLAAMQEEDKRIQWGAANLLGGIRDPLAIAPLITVLNNKDYKVSGSAANALQKFGESAVLPLIEALKDGDSEVRAQAASILGNLRNKQAVEPLIDALHDWNGRVRRQAVNALGKLGDRRALEPLITTAKDPDREVRRLVGNAVGQIDPDWSVELLIIALKDEDEDVRLAAARDLYRIGRNSRAVEPLMAALKDEEWHVREYAGYALIEHGDQRAVEPLIENLQDERALVAWAAARALGAIGDNRAIEPLIVLLRDEVQQQCSIVAEALVKFGERVMPMLLAELKDEGPNASFYSWTYIQEWRERGRWLAQDPSEIKNAHLHYYTAQILGEVADICALPVLLWMKDNDFNETVYGRERVQDAAAKAIENICQRHWNITLLVATLEDHDIAKRIGAAFALGMRGDERAAEGLIAALTDTDRRVRWVAARLLGNFRDDQAIAALIAALEDEDMDVRRSATAALVKTGEAAIEPLIEALREKRKTPAWIAHVLSEIGETALQPLIAALRDESSNVRYWVANALGHMGNNDAVNPLNAALEDEDSFVRLSVAAALTKLGDSQAMELLLAALNDGDKDMRGAAAINLGVTGNTEAVEPLIAALNDEDSNVRYWAVVVLGDIGDSSALPALERLAQTYHPSWGYGPYEQEWMTNGDSEESQIDERLRDAASKAIQRIKRRYE